MDTDIKMRSRRIGITIVGTAALAVAACDGTWESPTAPSVTTTVPLADSSATVTAHARTVPGIDPVFGTWSGSCTLQRTPGGARARFVGDGVQEARILYRLAREDGTPLVEAVVMTTTRGTFRTGWVVPSPQWTAGEMLRCTLESSSLVLADSGSFPAP